MKNYLYDLLIYNKKMKKILLLLFTAFIFTWCSMQQEKAENIYFETPQKIEKLSEILGSKQELW